MVNAVKEGMKILICIEMIHEFGTSRERKSTGKPFNLSSYEIWPVKTYVGVK